MNFNEHSRFAGKHAVISASTHSWLNYDEEKMLNRLKTMEAAARGTRLHRIAADLINEGLKLSANGSTMSLYVNDAIGYAMTPEQVLYVSDVCFGTTDAISFARGKLRIHDLKTGEGPAHFEQLMIYAAMFCIEYDVKPFEIEMELRIYQNKDKQIMVADPEQIVHIIDHMRRMERVVTKARTEELV